MKPMKCKFCASTTFTESGQYLQCDYCNTRYTTEQARGLIDDVKLDRSEESAKLLRLTRSLLSRSNLQDAREAIGKALELDPDAYDVWLVRAEVTALSGVAQHSNSFTEHAELRTADVIADLHQAKTLTEDEAEVRKCGATALEIARKVIDQGAANRTWYPEVSSAQLVPLLRLSYEYDPSDYDALKLIVDLESYRHGCTGGMTPGEAQRVRGESAANYASAVQVIQRRDPTYAPPALGTFKGSNCFVITATMGEERALPVVILRAYRDEVLVRSRAGRTFIGWYGRKGPVIASIISGSIFLRVLTFFVVVVPATVVGGIAVAAHRLSQIIAGKPHLDAQRP